jgi:hypothetical protein
MYISKHSMWWGEKKLGGTKHPLYTALGCFSCFGHAIFHPCFLAREREREGEAGWCCCMSSEAANGHDLIDHRWSAALLLVFTIFIIKRLQTESPARLWTLLVKPRWVRGFGNVTRVSIKHSVAIYIVPIPIVVLASHPFYNHFVCRIYVPKHARVRSTI